jgi:hypothetical protein
MTLFAIINDHWPIYVDWLNNYLRFYIPLKNSAHIWRRHHCRWLINYLPFYLSRKKFSLIWTCHHCQWRAAKFRPMLSAQGLWAGGDLYRATPTVTGRLGFFSFIRRIASFNRLLRHALACRGFILTRILKGLHCRWRVAKFRPMLCTYGFWAGRDLYRVIPAVTHDFGFCGLLWRRRRLALTTYMRVWRMYSHLDPHGAPYICIIGFIPLVILSFRHW